jgi:hypothetical protein
MTDQVPIVELVTCLECASEVEPARHCTVCGARLGEGARPRGFAAAPDQPALLPSIVSTLLPQLPRADLAAFSLALGLGTGLVVVLAALGYYPVALVAGAIVVPLLLLVYLVAVDVYEDEPLRVLLLTLAWGVVTGALYAILLRALFPDTAGPFARDDLPTQVLRGVLLPAAATGVILVGPLALLPYRRFNDVLDGATFGALSGVGFVGSQIVVQSVDLLAAGLQPEGDVLSWVLRVLVHSIALPLVAAGALGGACGALWLRYRAPGRDRRALGPLGIPAVAVSIAIVLLVAANLALLHLRDVPRLVAVAALAVVALVWLRLVIHVGLRQEAVEAALAEPRTCQDCGRLTAPGSFCGECGVALRALPKRAPAARAAGARAMPDAGVPPGTASPETGPPRPTAPLPALAPRYDEPLRLSGGRSLLLFLAGMGVASVLVAIVVVLLAPQEPEPPCKDPTRPCPVAPARRSPAAAPTRPRPPEQAEPGSEPMRFGETFQDPGLGWQLDYEATIMYEGQAYTAWDLDTENEPGVVWLDRGWRLTPAGGATVEVAMWLRIEVVPAGDRTPADMLQYLLGYVSGILEGTTEQPDHATSLLGPHIGFVPAESRYLVGDTGEEGALTRWGAYVLAASDGRLTTGMVLYLSDPDATFPFFSGTLRTARYLGDAFDDLLKRFYWAEGAA